MADPKQLKGITTKIDQALLRHGNRIGKNLGQAARFILRHSQKIVPVLTGNLKASGYVRITGSGLATVAEVGYTASYSLYVEFNEEALHGEALNEAYADKIANNPKSKYWFKRGPNQRAGFLTSVIASKQGEIREIILKGT